MQQYEKCANSETFHLPSIQVMYKYPTCPFGAITRISHYVWKQKPNLWKKDRR